MTFKTYLLLLLHSFVAACILLSLPIFICCVFYSMLPGWLVCVMSLSSATIVTLYPSIRYVMYIGNKILKW